MYTYHSLTADEPVTNVTVLGNYGECYVEKLVEQLDYIENNIGSNFIKLTMSSEINDCRSVLVNKNKVIKVGDNSYNKCATITFEGNIVVDVVEPFEKVIEMIEKSCDKD